MRTRSLLSRLFVAAGFVAVLVAPSRAQRCVAPPCEESGAPVHAAIAAPNATADAHHPELRSDGSHAPLSTPEHHGEKHENRRATTGPMVKAQRPTHQRTKNANRNAPATPGMGQLLRMSSGTKSELTFDADMAHGRRSDENPGRGPPDLESHSDLAPLASPRAPQHQAPKPEPEHLLPRSAQPSTPVHSDVPTLVRELPARSVTVLHALPGPPQHGGSRDARAEGAESQPHHPSGGVSS